MPRGARPAPPRRHPGAARVDGPRGRRGRRDRHVPGFAAEARGVGPGRAHAGDQPEAAEIARHAVGEDRFVAGSIGPTGHLPASDDPTLGAITFAELVEIFTQQAQGLVRGGADLLIIETAQDILEVKAAIFGAREAFKLEGRTVPIQTSRLAAAQRRQDAAGHRHRRGADHAGGLEGRRHRPELLDRPQRHARRDPVPGRALVDPDPLHPERRPAPAGPQRRDDLPRGARRAGGRPGRVRRAARRLGRRRLLRHDGRPHLARSPSACAGTSPARAPRRARRRSPR